MLSVAMFPLFVMLPGTNIVTFYFVDVLSSASISDKYTAPDQRHSHILHACRCTRRIVVRGQNWVV
jgi:hypothetical protein